MGHRQSQIQRITVAADTLTPIDLGGAKQVAFVKGDDTPIGFRVYPSADITSNQYFRFVDTQQPLVWNVCDERLYLKSDSDAPGDDCVVCIWMVM